MRDILLLCIFLACIPIMLKRPSVGIVMWIWLSVMNPHRLAYGFAYGLQFAAATAIITIIAMMITKDERKFVLTPPVFALALFMLWICVTSLFPFHDGSGYDMWLRVMKIFLMTFVALAVIRTKQQIHWVIWILVASLAFYGAKGGLFTLLTGGTYLVWGPSGSFIEGNNEVALAFVITIPLMRYTQIGLPKKWQKIAMLAIMLLCTFAAIGSHSRGALVAIAAMGTFLWWKSRNKFAMALALLCASIVVLSFMPAEWFTRMGTIKSYDEDESALGRINAWWMAFHLASDRPLGGGFEIYDYDLFPRYAPNPLDVHAAHSIYFQVLGEHGFLGLFLFVLIGACTWAAASDGKRKAKGIPGYEWVAQLMDMCKVSMIGYAVGGAFLSLAYFDVPYYVMVIVVATRALAVEARRAQVPDPHRDGFSRRNRFGAVALNDDEPEPEQTRPARGRGVGDWRGQGAFQKSTMSFGATEVPK